MVIPARWDFQVRHPREAGILERQLGWDEEGKERQRRDGWGRPALNAWRVITPDSQMPINEGRGLRKTEAIMELGFQGPTGFERQVPYAHGDVQQAIRRKGWNAQIFPDYPSYLCCPLLLQEPSPLSDWVSLWLLNVAPWIRTHALDTTELESNTHSPLSGCNDIVGQVDFSKS